MHEWKKQFERPPVSTLPDLIGRALVHNASAVIALTEHKRLLHAANTQLLDIQVTNTHIVAENTELRRLLEQHTHSSAQSIQEQQRIEGQLRVELNEAVELAERQKALTETLEAKLESTKRERQLTSAQLSSCQQRMDALDMRLATETCSTFRRTLCLPRAAAYMSSCN